MVQEYRQSFLLSLQVSSSSSNDLSLSPLSTESISFASQPPSHSWRRSQRRYCLGTSVSSTPACFPKGILIDPPFSQRFCQPRYAEKIQVHITVSPSDSSDLYCFAVIGSAVPRLLARRSSQLSPTSTRWRRVFRTSD